MRIRWAESVANMGDKKYGCSVLVGNPERRRPLGRLEVNIFTY
jgi:hypothetical protein